ncbi:hypothetical protein ANN_01187 [Periplaneta americana]|uniref:Reverse transcriptase n=1 Tax=Periplaneta americana TaxID=6978 RepID=A0ABQ8TTZ7_PERAM|nr:hypothetical protein ANN_01187 [Periplaneta americana]
MGAAWCRDRVAASHGSKNPLDRVIVQCVSQVDRCTLDHIEEKMYPGPKERMLSRIVQHRGGNTELRDHLCVKMSEKIIGLVVQQLSYLILAFRWITFAVLLFRDESFAVSERLVKCVFCESNLFGKENRQGVILYSEFTPSNKWITKPDGMTSGEWKEAIKMTANVSAVRAIPGRSQDNLCRRCFSEIETLGHVLGACPYGETLRIHRHHAIRTKLADALRKLKYTVYEEVHGTADNGSNRRIDIIAISESLSQGMTIDPTIRFETYKGQPEDVHEEKGAIYVTTIPYYKDKYQLHDISVTGLMFEARGTIPNFSSQFCKTLGLHKSFLNELALLIIKESIKLLRNHVYGL